MIRALIWKEWRENGWKLVFGLILLCGMTTISLHARMFPDGLTMLFLFAVGGLFLPLLAAGGVLGAEREGKTIGFLTALPVSSRVVLLIKTVSAMLAVTVPLLASGTIFHYFAGQRELSSDFFWSLNLGIIWSTCNLIVWTVAFSVGQPTEARTIAVGIGVFVVWCLFLIAAKLLEDLVPYWASANFVILGLEILIPLNILDLDIHDTPQAAATVIIQSVLMYCIFRFTARRLALNREARQ